MQHWSFDMEPKLIIPNSVKNCAKYKTISQQYQEAEKLPSSVPVAVPVKFN